MLMIMLDGQRTVAKDARLASTNDLFVAVYGSRCACRTSACAQSGRQAEQSAIVTNALCDPSRRQDLATNLHQLQDRWQGGRCNIE